jgi:hypothetical protein
MTKADPSKQRPISRGIAVDELENGSRQHVLNHNLKIGSPSIPTSLTRRMFT